MYDSSVAVHWEDMVVFQQFIVLADKDGVVDMTPLSISRRTGMPLEMIEQAIFSLELTDSSSRSIEHEGRRIVRLDKHRDWGWFIPTYKNYSMTVGKEVEREQAAERMRRYRKKKATKK
jgi:hypothetical protein